MSKRFMSPVWPARRAFQAAVQEENLMSLLEHNTELERDDAQLLLQETAATETLPFLTEKNIARKPSLPKAWRQI